MPGKTACSLLRRTWAASGLGGVLHCFTGTWEHAKRALDMGFMISFAGNVTFPKAQQIRDAAKEVPLDRMLIETDCHFSRRRRIGESAMSRRLSSETARQLGELRGLSTEEDGRSRRPGTSIVSFRFPKRPTPFSLVAV